MESTEQRTGWLAKSGLSLNGLNELVSSWSIDRSQIIAVTEPVKGEFTIIFDPTPEQRRLEAERLAEAAEAGEAYFQSMPIRFR